MTTDVTVVEPGSTEANESDDAAFEAGFKAESGEESGDVATPPSDTPATVGEQPTAAEQFADELASDGNDTGAAGADGATASAAEVQAAVAGLTPQEVESLRIFLSSERGSLKQGLDKVAGNVGGLKRTLDQLQAVQRSQPQGSLAAEGARKLAQQIKASVGKNIANDYPELSARLEATLTEAFDGITAQAAAPAIDEEELDRRVKATAADLFAQYVLEDEHGEDWAAKLALKDETGAPVRSADGKFQPSPHFRAFLAEKGEEFTQRFRSTNSPRLISRTISEYEDWRATQSGQSTPAAWPASTPAAPARVAAAAPVARPGSNKQARLAAAVTPRGNAGGGSPTLTEDDAFELGFRSARGAL